MAHADDNLTPGQPPHQPPDQSPDQSPNQPPPRPPEQAPAWPMTVHPQDPENKTAPPPKTGWKLPPSPWDEPMPGVDHKRAPFKPGVQMNPWPAATVFGSGNAAIGAAGQANTAEHRVRASVAVDASGNVVADLICRRCGYALRGLNAAGKCPECGTEIADSLKSDQLIHADLEWLSAVASGLRWCWILALVGWLGDFAGVALAVAGVVQGGSEHMLGVLIGVPIIAAKMVMWWRWTKPERTADGVAAMAEGRAEGFTARKATRLFAMVSLGVFAVEAVALLIGLRAVPQTLGGAGQVAAFSLGAIASLLAIAKYTAIAACFFATCIYLKQLARRANDTSLLGYCQVTMIFAPVLAITLGCVVVGLVVAWFLWWAMLISAESTISFFVRTRKAAMRLSEHGGAAAET